MLKLLNLMGNSNRALDTLKFFHSVSGLKMSFEKTKVVQLGVKGDSGIKQGNIRMDNNSCATRH